MYMKNLEQELKENAYPGRGIVIGESKDGYSKSWKKAIVKLTEDSKPIEFFEGMM